MGQWIAFKKSSGTGWKELERESGTGWKALEWEHEDFTTFTEVDIAADRIQKTANHVDHYSKRDETTYLYKDYGANHFGDFTHKIKVKSDISGTGHGSVWCLANVVKNLKAMFDDGDTAIFLFFYPTNTIWLREYHSSSSYSDSGTISSDTWYYIRIVKSGTSLNVYIYSDADYSTLVDTLTLTLQADHQFRYLFACNSYNDGGTTYSQQDIESYDLVLRIKVIPSNLYKIYKRITNGRKRTEIYGGKANVIKAIVSGIVA